MSTRRAQILNRAEQALARLTRMREVLAEADAAIAELQGELARNLGHDFRDMADVQLVLFRVCQDYNLTPAVVLGRDRTQEVCAARRMAVSVAHILTPHTTVRLGAFFSRRHHSAIVEMLSKHGDEMDTDPQYKARFDRLVDSCAAIAAERKSA